MKRLILPLLLTIAATANAALEGLTIAWTDVNAASAQVKRYVVYDISTEPREVFQILDMPKLMDEPRDVQLVLDKSAAGKTLTVTAMNDLGLESDPASPPVTIPTLAVPPDSVRLSFDFDNRLMEITWEDPNVPTAEVQEFVVYRQSDETWEAISRVPATANRLAISIPQGKETYAVAAYSPWGETVRSISVSTPTLLVPVTNLRLITVQ
jgi:hypothetical protein